MSALGFISLGSDFMKFIQRMLSFYSHNFKIATHTLRHDSDFPHLSFEKQSFAMLEAKKRLDQLIYNIIPSPRALLKMLPRKRRGESIC
jgi:hypothetical protein